MSSKGRINVHCHISSPEYLELLSEQQARRTDTPPHGSSVREWTIESLLADMAEGEVTSSVISMPSPPRGVADDPGELRRFCRVSNEYVAGLMEEHPGRIGLFGRLPMPEVDASLAELEYVFDEFHADGVLMSTSYGDRWLADESFAPIFEELNRRRSVVYTHPHVPTCCAAVLPELNIAPAVVEFETDTARSILQLVFGGMAKRFPNIRFIFSHAGGTMPILIERFKLLASSPRFRVQFPDGFTAPIGEFFYDTAQTANPTAMGALRSVVPTSQIVFGTDFPIRTATEHVDGLRTCGVFDESELAAIDFTNALGLFPRLDVA